LIITITKRTLTLLYDGLLDMIVALIYMSQDTHLRLIFEIELPETTSIDGLRGEYLLDTCGTPRTVESRYFPYRR